MRLTHGMAQNAREESSKAPYALNKKPQAGFLCKASNPIDPACKAVRPVGDAEGWLWAASARGGGCTLRGNLII